MVDQRSEALRTTDGWVGLVPGLRGLLLGEVNARQRGFRSSWSDQLRSDSDPASRLPASPGDL